MAQDSDLSLEGLLLQLTTLHARNTIVQLYHHLASSGDFKEEDLELIPSTTSAADTTTTSVDLPTIRLHLFSAHSVVLALNPLSGKLEFRAPGEVSNAREARLRNAAEKVNAAPGGQLAAAGETLLRVRASTILDEVESRALYLGLQTTRRLPLRGVDLARFGEGTRSCLFVKLRVGEAGKGAGAPSHHYLVLVMTEVGFRFALMGAREGSDQMQSWLGVEEVGWLERGGVGKKEEVKGGEWGAAGQGKGKEREGDQKEAMGCVAAIFAPAHLSHNR